jgi:hypothetical protein
MDNTRFVPEEKIEVVRKAANSKEECLQIKSDLEGRGFKVTVREPPGSDAESGWYYATLFAEKRETVMVDTWAVEREKRRLRTRDRIIDITTKAGFWVVIALLLIAWLFWAGPLFRACRAL